MRFHAVLTGVLCLLAASVVVLGQDHKDAKKDDGPGLSSAAISAYHFNASMSFDEARKALHPICLLAFDDRVAVNHDLMSFASLVFTCPKGGKDKKAVVNTDVQEALNGYTCVQAATSSKDWPAGYLAQAQGGARLMLMTCDGRVLAGWKKVMPKEFAATAVQVKAANAQVADAIKRRQDADAKRGAPAKDAPPDAKAAAKVEEKK